MKILIVSNTTKNNFSEVEDRLSKYRIDFADTSDYTKKIKNYKYVIAGREKYTEEILRKANRLQIISRCGHGTDAIDKEYCKIKNIKVIDAKGALDATMADATIGYMIMALRRLKEIDFNTRANGWKPILGNDLTGKTVGIIGLGGIGRSVAIRLKGFKTRTIFFDINPVKQYSIPRLAEYVPLSDLLMRSDIITLHCDLNETSKNMINKYTISKMKDGVMLINTARGGIIKHLDLKQALLSNKIQYAVLDVYPVEPLPRDDEIKNFNNVLLGCHSTCYSVEGQRKLAVRAVDNLLEEIKKC